MFLCKLQRFLTFKASHQLKRNYFGLAQTCNTLSKPSERKIIQFVSCRTAVNYERNINDQNRSSHKISRTFICFKYMRLIRNAIREFGPSPIDNPRLVYLIENAQKHHISPDFINFAIRMSTDIRAQIGFIDLFLGNGCHFIVQYDDVDALITKHHLLELCDRYDGNIIQNDTYWTKSYKQKGMIWVRCNDSDPFAGMPKDKLISRLGIESYHKETDAEGVQYWKLLCDPWKLPDVKKQCEEIVNSVEEAYVGYIPKKIVTPSPFARSSVYNVLIKLCEVPSIDNLYCNINLAHFRS